MSSLTRRHLTPVSRRSFLAWSAVAGAGVALSPRSWGQVVGANSDIRVAVLGLNGRGGNHLSSLANVKGVRVVALCDPDTAVLDRVKNRVAKSGVSYASAKTYTDLRELFASPDIDAVTIATPNHWHALAGIWAMQAGKDVYLEKPVSHNVWEGRQLVLAAKKYNRVVQAGTQIRSGAGLQEAVAWIRAGNLGKITASRGFCYKRRDSIGKTTAPTPVPATIDYDLWSGPAPIVPPHRNSRRYGPVHYDWHWVSLYGNGDVGNQGIHQMDVARWFLGESGLPRHTLSIGGRLGYEDDGDTPNTQVVVHDYASAPLIFEVRGLPSKFDGRSSGAETTSAAAPMDRYRGQVEIGNVIDCEGGYLTTASYFSATAYDKDGKMVKEFRGTDRHMQNFIDVVRSKKLADLYGPIEEGHVSSALCHLGGLSHQLGRAQSPEAVVEQIQGNKPLAEAYGRMTEHLAANNVDLKKTPATLGLPLAVDVKNERFTGPTAAAANRLLTREYRAPYVVPKFAT
jgi:predicted dehydrogenase